MVNGVQGYGAYGQWGTAVWDTWAMRHRGMGHMGSEAQEYGVQGYGAHVWAMRYRGMGTHGQWGTGVWGIGV